MRRAKSAVSRSFRIGAFLSAAAFALISVTLDAMASECTPLTTRPTDDVALVRFPVGRDRIEDIIAGCQVSDGTPVSRFAKATFLVRVGDSKEAIALLEPLTTMLFDPASLLLADLYTEQGASNSAALENAIRIYRPLADKDSREAMEGLGIALLRARRDAESRSEAVRLLREAANQGAPLAEARLGAALVDTAVNETELQLGVQTLENSAAHREVAGQIALAKNYLTGKGLFEKDVEPRVVALRQDTGGGGGTLGAFLVDLIANCCSA